MTTQTISQFIGEVKRSMEEHAEASMLRPKHDLFGLGESAGIYQGMQKSLDILDGIIRDIHEQEKQS